MDFDHAREYATLRAKQMEQARSNFNNLWEQTAKVVMPDYSMTFNTQNYGTQGQRKDYEQFDATAYQALVKGAAALESLICPDGSRWHSVTSAPFGSGIFQKSRAALEYYDDVTSALFAARTMAYSGFSSAKHEVMQLIMGFGNGVIFVEEMRDPVRPWMRGLRYVSIPLGECFFGVSDQGVIDTVMRKYRPTVRGLAQRFGMEKLPQSLREKLEKSPDDRVECIHIVAPNAEMDHGSLLSTKRPFISIYMLNEKEKDVLEVSGYYSMPYCVFRHHCAPGEAYGRGPAQSVLTNIKMLNEEKKIVLKQGMKAVDPILLVNDDGILDRSKSRPGAVISNAVTEDGRPLVHTLETGNHAIGKDMMDDEKAVINDAFNLNLFQILTENPQMTATEVLQRAQEKAALLAPPATRIQHEGFAPLVHREFDLLARMGMMPEPPVEVVEAGAQYHVEFDAPINRMMRAEAAQGITQAIDWAAKKSVDLQDPSLMDWFNMDTITPEVVMILGGRPAYINTAETVAAKRQGRQQQQETQQMIAAAPGMAAMLKATNMGGQ